MKYEELLQLHEALDSYCALLALNMKMFDLPTMQGNLERAEDLRNKVWSAIKEEKESNDAI